MREIRTSGSMSGERKRSDAAWPKPPRFSSTLLGLVSQSIQSAEFACLLHIGFVAADIAAQGPLARVVLAADSGRDEFPTPVHAAVDAGPGRGLALMLDGEARLGFLRGPLVPFAAQGVALDPNISTSL